MASSIYEQTFVTLLQYFYKIDQENKDIIHKQYLLVWLLPVLGHNPIASLDHCLFYTADDFSSVDVTGLKPW